MSSSRSKRGREDPQQTGHEEQESASERLEKQARAYLAITGYETKQVKEKKEYIMAQLDLTNNDPFWLWKAINVLGPGAPQQQSVWTPTEVSAATWSAEDTDVERDHIAWCIANLWSFSGHTCLSPHRRVNGNSRAWPGAFQVVMGIPMHKLVCVALAIREQILKARRADFNSENRALYGDEDMRFCKSSACDWFDQLYMGGSYKVGQRPTVVHWILMFFDACLTVRSGRSWHELGAESFSDVAYTQCAANFAEVCQILNLKTTVWSKFVDPGICYRYYFRDTGATRLVDGSGVGCRNKGKGELRRGQVRRNGKTEDDLHGDEVGVTEEEDHLAEGVEKLEKEVKRYYIVYECWSGKYRIKMYKFEMWVSMCGVPVGLRGPIDGKSHDMEFWNNPNPEKNPSPFEPHTQQDLAEADLGYVSCPHCITGCKTDEGGQAAEWLCVYDQDENVAWRLVKRNEETGQLQPIDHAEEVVKYVQEVNLHNRQMAFLRWKIRADEILKKKNSKSKKKQSLTPEEETFLRTPFSFKRRFVPLTWGQYWNRYYAIRRSRVERTFAWLMGYKFWQATDKKSETAKGGVQLILFLEHLFQWEKFTRRPHHLLATQFFRIYRERATSSQDIAESWVISGDPPYYKDDVESNPYLYVEFDMTKEPIKPWEQSDHGMFGPQCNPQRFDATRPNELRGPTHQDKCECGWTKTELPQGMLQFAQDARWNSVHKTFLAGQFPLKKSRKRRETKSQGVRPAVYKTFTGKLIPEEKLEVFKKSATLRNTTRDKRDVWGLGRYELKRDPALTEKELKLLGGDKDRILREMPGDEDEGFQDEDIQEVIEDIEPENDPYCAK